MPKTVRIRMLGNYQEFEVGKTYDVPAERAMALSGMGFAVVVEDPPAVEKTAKE